MGIGERIKYLRDLHDLTQSELGKIAGVSDKAVSTWENGSAEPRMGAIQKLSDHFGVSKSWLIGDSPLHDTEPDLVIVDDDERLLLNLYRSLNTVGKKRALQDLEDLVQIERYIKIQNCERSAI